MEKSYHNDICRWKRHIFADLDVFLMNLKLQGESSV